MSGSDRLEPFLRRRPPEAALRWAAGAAGAGATVARVRRLRGGTSSAMHALDVVDRSGLRHRLVLRRYVRADWLELEPDLAEREARVLSLLAGSSVPAAELVAVDPDGRVCDAPAVLMTRRPGRLVLEPSDVETWLRRTAALLPLIHAVDSRAEQTVQAYTPYYDPAELSVPA